jgi:hypothetical protein
MISANPDSEIGAARYRQADSRTKSKTIAKQRTKLETVARPGEGMISI